MQLTLTLEERERASFLMIELEKVKKLEAIIAKELRALMYKIERN